MNELKFRQDRLVEERLASLVQQRNEARKLAAVLASTHIHFAMDIDGLFHRHPWIEKEIEGLDDESIRTD